MSHELIVVADGSRREAEAFEIAPAATVGIGSLADALLTRTNHFIYASSHGSGSPMLPPAPAPAPTARTRQPPPQAI